MLGKVPSDMCAQQRFKSACTFAKSDQSSLLARRKPLSLAIQNAPREEADLYLPWVHMTEGTLFIAAANMLFILTTRIL